MTNKEYTQLFHYWIEIQERKEDRKTENFIKDYLEKHPEYKEENVG